VCDNHIIWLTEFIAITDHVSIVTAFTCFHESGIGGAPKYGVVPQMPLTTLEGVNVLDNLTYMQPRVQQDFASVGYYRSKLQNGVEVELSASRHSGILQYTFPSAGHKIVLVDVSHHLPSNAEAEPLKSQTYSNGQLVVGDAGAQYTGWGVWKGGWNGGEFLSRHTCPFALLKRSHSHCKGPTIKYIFAPSSTRPRGASRSSRGPI
jgi:hypothetical protein